MKSEHNNMCYQAKKIEKDVIVITEGMVQIYLVCGEKKTLLIDTGIGGGSLREFVSRLSDKPLIVANTHGHFDHVGADGQFDIVYVNSRDWELLKRSTYIDRTELRDLKEGTVLDLGGRQLEVKEVPGHTPGSVLFLDRENRIVFCGDYVSDKTVFLSFDESSPEDYILSLEKIISLKADADYLMGCHGKIYQSFSQAESLKKCTEATLKGLIIPIYEKVYDDSMQAKYSLGDASIYAPYDIVTDKSILSGETCKNEKKR